MDREQEVGKKQKSRAEERQQQEAVEGWRKGPQRESSQEEEWEKVEGTGTEGDEKIGSAREAFEPRERVQRR